MKGDLSAFGCGVVVGSRGVGLSILETAEELYWEFPTKPFLGLIENGSKKQKITSEPKDREEWPDHLS